jgi:hypothetical protein
MPPFSPIQPWLLGYEVLPPFARWEPQGHRAPDQQICFVTFDVVVPIHRAATIPSQNLAESWEAASEYIRQSTALFGVAPERRLPSRKADLILDRLGPPPVGSYPIYFITASSRGAERVVYIGKTSARKGRFAGGHAALTKLHHPRYVESAKRLYLGCVPLQRSGPTCYPWSGSIPTRLRKRSSTVLRHS